MTTNKVLNATPRTVTGKQVAALRRAGQLPAAIYGNGEAATLVQLEMHPASLTINRMNVGGELTLNIAGEPQNVRIQEIQRDAIRGALVHIDFIKA